ncbi:MAG: hypothetical protein NZT61_02160 [Deltaproteobacteria bacterium]|nr:hypothetical protein [Deltaproteobacteria bacterium]
MKTGSIEPVKSSTLQPSHAAEKLTQQFMGLFLKELFKNIQIPGKSVEKEFLKDSLIEALSKKLVELDTKLLSKLTEELEQKKI